MINKCENIKKKTTNLKYKKINLVVQKISTEFVMFKLFTENS